MIKKIIFIIFIFCGTAYCRDIPSYSVGNMIKEAEIAVKLKDYKYAVDIYQKLIQHAGDKVYGSYGVKIFCQKALSNLPKEALDIYKQLWNKNALGLFKKWETTGRYKYLYEILSLYINTSYGDTALCCLGDYYRDIGETGTALSLYRRIKNPDKNIELCKDYLLQLQAKGKNVRTEVPSLAYKFILDMQSGHFDMENTALCEYADEIYAVNDEGRLIKWKFKNNDISVIGLVHPVPDSYGFIYIYGISKESNDFYLIALDASDKEVEWKTSLGKINPAALVPLKFASCIYNGIIYCNTPMDRICSVDAFTGDLIWQQGCEEVSDINNSFIDSSMAADNGILYVVSKISKKIYAIRIEDGKLDWVSSIEKPDKLIGIGKYIYVSNDTSVFAIDKIKNLPISAVNTAFGRMKWTWKKTKDDGIKLETACMFKNLICIPSGQEIYFLSADRGEIMGTFKPVSFDDKPITSVLEKNGYFYISGSKRTTVYENSTVQEKLPEFLVCKDKAEQLEKEGKYSESADLYLTAGNSCSDKEISLRFLVKSAEAYARDKNNEKAAGVYNEIAKKYNEIWFEHNDGFYILGGSLAKVRISDIADGYKVNLPVNEISLKDAFLNLKLIMQSPVETSVLPFITEQTVAFANLKESSVMALDKSTGSIKWSLPAKQFSPKLSYGKYISSFAYKKGTIFHCDSDLKVAAFNEESGRKAWEYFIGNHGKISSSVISLNIVDDLLYVYASKNGIYAIDAGSGKLVWKAAKGCSVPVYAGDVIFAVFEDSTLRALRAVSGEVLAQYKLDINADVSLSYSGGKLIVLGDDGSCYALELCLSGKKDFNLKWKQKKSEWADSSPVCSNNGNVFFASYSTNTVFALKINDGSIAWEYKNAGIGRFSAPVSSDKYYILCVLGDEKLFVLDSRTGKEVWKEPEEKMSMNNGIVLPPVIKNDNIVVCKKQKICLFEICEKED